MPFETEKLALDTFKKSTASVSPLTFPAINMTSPASSSLGVSIRNVDV